MYEYCLFIRLLVLYYAVKYSMSKSTNIVIEERYDRVEPTPGLQVAYI